MQGYVRELQAQMDEARRLCYVTGAAAEPWQHCAALLYRRPDIASNAFPALPNVPRQLESTVWTRSHQGLRHGPPLLHGLQQREGGGAAAATGGGGALNSFFE